jgi:hypothetical protein
MSHLLATVNPAAADAIDHPPEQPDIGTWVVFKGRAGFSRMHRTEFPAMVLGHQPADGTLTLYVVMEPEDVMMEDRVPFQSHNQEHFCWRWRKVSEGERANAMNGDINRLNDLAKRVSEIEDYLQQEDALGDTIGHINVRLNTVENVMASDEVEVLEKRVAALEGATKLPAPKPRKGK